MPAKFNKEWHLAHRMPENATIEQRIEWYLEHARVCKCREMPESIKKELRKRKLQKTTQGSSYGRVGTSGGVVGGIVSGSSPG